MHMLLTMWWGNRLMNMVSVDYVGGGWILHGKARVLIDDRFELILAMMIHFA